MCRSRDYIDPIDQLNPPLLAITLLRILIMKSCYFSSKGLPRHSGLCNATCKLPVIRSLSIYHLTSLLRTRFQKKLFNQFKTVSSKCPSQSSQLRTVPTPPYPGYPYPPKAADATELFIRVCRRGYERSQNYLIFFRETLLRRQRLRVYQRYTHLPHSINPS